MRLGKLTVTWDRGGPVWEVQKRAGGKLLFYDGPMPLGAALANGRAIPLMPGQTVRVIDVRTQQVAYDRRSDGAVGRDGEL